MSRFDADDPRDSDRPEPSSREPQRDERTRPAEALIRPLDERTRFDPRAHREPSHTLDLPTGPHREPVRDHDHLYQLRGSDVELLESAGRFRAAFAEDLVHATADPNRAREDLRSLVRQDLIAERTITRMNDGRSEDVVSLTAGGKDLLDHHRDPDADRGQVYYAGWVKSKELWHDASLLRLSRQATEDVEADGGRVLRVVLDDELKALVYRDLERERECREGDEDWRLAIGAVHHVPLVDGHFQFPDLRLEIETADGEWRDVDLEIVTEHYHRGHLGGKQAAGFRLYGSTSRSGGVPQDFGRARRYLR
jgi:hypothetical protein